jgi:hypothetical protein
MAANLDIYLDTGGANGNAATNTDTDGLCPPRIRFKRADDPTIDTNNPMTIPAAGTNYSRWKQIYLKCIGTAPTTKVDNIRFYTDAGCFGAGITVKVGTDFPTNNTGAPESGYEVADTEDEEMVASHGGIAGSADAFGYTSGAPLSGPSISEGSNQIDAIGEMTNYLVLQMECLRKQTQKILVSIL